MKLKKFFAFGAWALFFAWAFQCASANDAEVVMVVGKGEVRDAGSDAWRPVSVQQKISAGASVRTGESSQMAIVLSDQTQLRVNQQTALQIAYVADQKEGTTLDLVRGRVWTQVKRAFYSVKGLVSSRQNVSVRVPAATIGIRGTDWDLEVGSNGEARLTVLSGQAEIKNEFGQVFVGPNEQATAERGKAPVKSLLSNARDRVQWVSSYRPEPSHWVKQLPGELAKPFNAIVQGAFVDAQRELEPLAPRSVEAALLLADLQIFFGQADQAVKTVEPYADNGRGDARAVVLQSRAKVVSGQLDDARQLLAEGLKGRPDNADLSLALAEVARLQGNADQALALFRAVAMKSPDRDEAWFGIGRIESEKENLGAARKAMAEAIRRSPQTAGYYGEQATIEVHAGNPVEARKAFDEALRRQPDDYVAWTGLGMLQLKTGETEAALQSFLKAGVLEPRFARAHLYTAVAYYRLENSMRAIESLRKAVELDPKDPLPHIMLGLIHGDALALGESTDAAKAAQTRMPFLKSLNQVLNNQKGSANVGASLAAQGMEEWARAYAVDSYNLFWAGSALFLSDRYPDGFNKNSELYKGYLLDPAAFGASNRFSSLVSTPGHYGSASYQGSRADFTQHSIQGRLNGLTGTGIPVSYSLIGESAKGKDTRTDQSTFEADGRNLILGLGAKPSYASSVFYFGTGTNVDGRFTDPSRLPDANLEVQTWRQDGGIGYRFNATNQMVLKGGIGKQDTKLKGSQYDTANATSLTVGSFLVTSPNAQLERNDVDVEQKDVQFRHAFDWGGSTRITWGYEHARDERDLLRGQRFSASMPTCLTFGPPPALIPAGCVPVPLLDTLVEQDAKSTTGYLSFVQKFGDTLQIQADAFQQRTRINSNLLQVAQVIDDRAGASTDILRPTVVTQTETENAAKDELNHRVGARWVFLPGASIRSAYQRWRRPVGTGTLAPTDTVGVPVEDRLVQPGGQLRRYHLRVDTEVGRNKYFQVFADRKRVANVVTAADPFFKEFGLTELASLKSRKPVFDQPFDEWEKAPEFGEGEVRSGGVMANWQATSRLAFAGRYINIDSENSGAGFNGKILPFIPRHYVNLSSFWQAGGRLLLGTKADYRTSRFKDEANVEPLGNGWAFGLKAYWETEDKRLSVEASANNLHKDKADTVELRSQMNLNLTYRF